MVKIFIGTDRSQRLALKVLSHSIKSNTNAKVDIQSMEGIAIPEPKDVRQSQRTGFSFARWAIPELCNYQGKAIYLDADMLLFSDIGDLWNSEMGDATIAIVDGRNSEKCASGIKLNKNETSVMLIDCSKAKWNLAELVSGLDCKYDYHGMMSDLCFLEESDINRNIARSWNSMDYWDDNVDLVHYTNVPTQPWVSVDNPYGYIWVDYLKNMLQESALGMEEIKQEVDLGYIRPSLLIELNGETAKILDVNYIKRLKRVDQSFGYIPHREVQEWNNKRTLAIKNYEKQLAKSRGIKSYFFYVINDYYCLVSNKLRMVKSYI